MPGGDSVSPPKNRSNQDNDDNKKFDLFELTTEPPERLNKDFMEKVLREYENDPSLHIHFCEFTPATKPGDNFASEIFRANVKYTTVNAGMVSKSIIVKIKAYKDGFRKDLFGKLPLFETEGAMYTKVLPEMKKLLAQLGDNQKLFPDLIYLSSDTVVLEDMSPHGYVMRHEAMNFENTKKVILELAKFHALSFYMHYDQEIPLDGYKSGLVNTASMKSMKSYAENYAIAANCIKSWAGFEHIGQRMENIEPYFMQRLKEIYTPSQTREGMKSFNVLNHGDFHIKNILFVNCPIDDDILKILLLDFQVCVWGTPAIDLAYVMYCNASPETRINHRDELVRIYHERFCSILKQLGCHTSPPSLLELHIDILKNGFLEILLVVQFMAIFYMDFNKDTPKTTGEYRKRSKTNCNAMRADLEKVIKQFYDKGYLAL